MRTAEQTWGEKSYFFFPFMLLHSSMPYWIFFTQFAKGARFLSESPVMLVLVLEKEKWFLLES